MSVRVPVKLSDAIEEGSYEAEFAFRFPLTVKTPQTVDVYGYHVSLDFFQVNDVNGSTLIRYSVTKLRGATGEWNPETNTYIQAIPAAGIVLGAVVGLFGLVLIYLTLTRLEKIVDSPGVNIALVAASIVALYIIYRNL